MTTYLSLTANLVRSGSFRCNHPVEVTFVYDAQANPLAVSMAITSPSAEEGVVTWTFARDLIVTAANCDTETGAGDVKLRADETLGILYICLRNPQEATHADFEVPLESMRNFLAETTEEAARGRMILDADIDLFLEEVLGG